MRILGIKREIDCRTRFIICDSENSQASKWVQSEVAYIKSQQRSYETIDLSKSDEEIKEQLDKLVKSTQIFFCGSAVDHDILDSVYSHIEKYDIRSSFDLSNMGLEVNYQQGINNAIELLKDSGFFVFFASGKSLSSNKVISELQYAIANGVKILVLLLDEYAMEHCIRMFPSGSILTSNFIDIDTTSNDVIKAGILFNATTKGEIVELAIEEIVNMAFSPWTTYTMAKNLLDGIDCPKDDDEANRLFRISFRKANALYTRGYPCCALIVARCMANGYGTSKDLEGALGYYSDYLRTSGNNDNIDKEIAAVKRELEKQKQKSNKKTRKAIMPDYYTTQNLIKESLTTGK